MDYKKMKHVLLPIIFFTCILTIGIVYAATTGILALDGTTVINPGVRVIFNKVSVSRASDGYSSQISQDGQTLSFYLPLDPEHPQGQVLVDVYNSGNVPVMLGDLTDRSQVFPGITVNWPEGFNGLRLEPGAYSPKQKIDVFLTDHQMSPGIYRFSATLSYEQVT